MSTLVRPISGRPLTSGSAQSHPAICTECGTTTTVPFRPAQGRPVYCRLCFQDHRNGPSFTVKAPVDEQLTSVDSPPVDNTPDGVSAFPGMPLKAATRAAILRMNISEPTPIQEEAIPHLLEGRDLIGQARTGSGKTLAFAVPMVEQCDASLRQIQALVLVPTRELAIQVAGSH